MALSAQHRPGNPDAEGAHKLSDEQLATLRTKKLALALDLSERQQEQVFELQREAIGVHREARAAQKARRAEGPGTRPTAEARYDREVARLDRLLERQRRLKEILDDQQYAKWKRLEQRRARGHRKGAPGKR